MAEEVIEDVDERRLNRVAYEYLCRCAEVRSWLCDCLKDDDIVVAGGLEENMRNGVLLARLSNAFAPDVVPEKGIFDINQTKYEQNENVPVYRHTDNIMQWRRAMESVHLPEIFIPETADVFEGRNTKTIFCLYALATLLHRQRKAPPIRNLSGHAKFSVDELKQMKSILKDSTLPEFRDVGNILSDRKRKNVDVESEALEKIRQAVKDNDATELLNALKSSNASIEYVEGKLINSYMQGFQSSESKENDCAYTKVFVQNVIISANNENALEQLEEILTSSGTLANSQDLLGVLDLLQFEDIRPSAIKLYIDLLRRYKERSDGKLDKQAVIDVMLEANALVDIKIAAEHGSSEDVLNALSNPNLALSPVKSNVKLYYNRIKNDYEQHDENNDYYLKRDDLYRIIEEFGGISPENRIVLELNESISNDDREGIKNVFEMDEFVNVYIEEHVEYYAKRIRNRKFDSVDDVCKFMESVNRDVQQAIDELKTLIHLNEAIKNGDEKAVGSHLERIVKSTMTKAYRPELTQWYHRRLLSDPEEKKNLGTDNKEKWIDHDVNQTKVFMESTSLKTSSNEPEHGTDKSMYNWKEIEELLMDENQRFDGYYRENETKVVKSQKALRRYLEKKRSEASEIEMKEKEEAAKKIQTRYKMYRHKKDFELLKTSDKPTLSLIRKFVKQLPQNEVDFSDDLEVAESKAEVIRLMNNNRQLDANLAEMDEKIGLLIKNRLNLSEVLAHREKTAETADAFAVRGMSIRKQKDRQNLATLEQLFYYLQTKSKYLANLVEGLNVLKHQEKSSIISDVVCPIFGFMSDNREQFLMVRLICELLGRCIEQLPSIETFATSECISSMEKLFNYEEFDNLRTDVCQSISEELTDFSVEESRVKTFHLDPAKLYEQLYGATMTAEKALQDEQVSQILSDSLSFLEKWSQKISDALMAKFKLPKSGLYIGSYLENILRHRFPSASAHQIDQCVGFFVYKVFIEQSMTCSSKLTKMFGKELSTDAIHRLTCIMQFIEFGVLNKGYGNDKWYLTVLNKQIHTINNRFTEFTTKSIHHVILDDIYSLNEFTQFDPFHKPTLSLIDRHVQAVLENVRINSRMMGADENDVVAELVKNSCLPPNVENDRMVTLQLHPSPKESLTGGNGPELFTKAKKQVVELLLCELEGENIVQMLDVKPTTSNELKLKQLYDETSVEQKQDSLRADLKKLEECGKTTSEDDYQSIVNDIAMDIRLMTRRQRERAEQKRCVAETKRKLIAQREELKEKMARYEEYLDTCLENLSRTSRRLSFRPTTKEAGKIQKERASLDQVKTYKSSAEKLIKKGVLIDIAGFESSKKLSKVSIEISTSSERGEFGITLIESGKIVDTYKLRFQELLKSESVEETTFVLDDKIVFDVMRTIQYINKKFYNK